VQGRENDGLIREKKRVADIEEDGFEFSGHMFIIAYRRQRAGVRRLWVCGPEGCMS
jgi:hypothetical protein